MAGVAAPFGLCPAYWMLLARPAAWRGERDLRRMLTKQGALLIQAHPLSSISSVVQRLPAAVAVTVLVHQRSACAAEYNTDEFEDGLRSLQWLRRDRLPGQTRSVLLEPSPRADGVPFLSFGDAIDLYVSESAPLREVLALAGRA